MLFKKNNAFEMVVERTVWFLSIAMEFTRLKPKCSMLMIFLLLLTQVMTLLTLIVPMKMIFLLAQEPYIPKTLLSYTFATKQELALFFFGVIIVMVAVYLSAEKLSQSREKRCSADIWKSKRKFSVYANQERMAAEMYRRYIATVMNLGLTLLIVAMIAYVFPLIALVFLLFWLLAGIGLIWLYDRNRSVRLALGERFAKVLNTFDLFGFFLAFLVLAYDLTYAGDKGNMIWGIISLILLRRAMNAVSAGITGVKSLYESKEKIETVFFSGQSGGEVPRAQKDVHFWDRLDKRTVPVWMEQVLEDVTGERYVLERYEWFELGLANEYAFTVTAVTERAKKEVSFFIKLFNQAIHSKAEREFAMLESGILVDYSLPFLGASQVEKHPCHVFEYRTLHRMDMRTINEKKAILGELTSSTALPTALTEPYVSAHKLLPERITPEMIERLKAVAVSEDEVYIETFEKNLPRLRAMMTGLPLRMILQQVSPFTLCKDDEEGFILLSLAHWQIEPLGFGFATNKQHLKKLEEVIVATGGTQNEIVAAKSVAYLAEIEGWMRRSLFVSAVENIKMIMQMYAELPETPER